MVFRALIGLVNKSGTYSSFRMRCFDIPKLTVSLGYEFSGCHPRGDPGASAKPVVVKNSAQDKNLSAFCGRDCLSNERRTAFHVKPEHAFFRISCGLHGKSGYVACEHFIWSLRSS
jgi:hypothetical protein